MKKIINVEAKIQDLEPYWFTKAAITKLQENVMFKDCTYMGAWCIKNGKYGWSNFPVEVFYQPNPDTAKGHSHYFGIYIDYESNKTMITNAASAFECDIMGILEDDVVYVSRYRRDYVLTPKGDSIDGGRDYLKLNGNPVLVNVKAEADKFIFTLNEDFTFWDYVRYYFNKIMQG